MKKKIITAVVFTVLVFTGAGLSSAENAAAPSFEGFTMEDAVINVAEKAGKSVVSISTETTAKPGGRKRVYFNSPFGGSPFGDDDNFRRFFEDFFGEMPQRDYKQMGLGSGVIIDPEGYILTNEHVISGADKIKVTLADGREFKGEVKGADMRSDLAIIKIDTKNLPSTPLGNSDKLKIGQWVVAVGNPFAFIMQSPEPTVTAGVISALHRSLGRGMSRERDYNDVIQTDAAINPGNSGGPLVNLKGEIVGINVAIFSTSGGYQGVGFAIPVNSAKKILAKLIAGKKILYGWLGVTVQDLSEDMSKYFGVAPKSGVLVAGVLSRGPAEKAGIKEGDIIKQFGDKTIPGTKELISIVSATEVGKKIKVTLLRDKKELSLDVEIGQRPQDIEKEELAKEEPGSWRGVFAQEITPDIAKQFDPGVKSGVVVTDIEPGSPADEAGIIPGDLILEVNKHPVKNLADYQKLTKGANGDCLIKTRRGFFLVKGG